MRNNPFQITTPTQVSPFQGDNNRCIHHYYRTRPKKHPPHGKGHHKKKKKEEEHKGSQAVLAISVGASIFCLLNDLASFSLPIFGSGLTWWALKNTQQLKQSLEYTLGSFKRQP